MAVVNLTDPYVRVPPFDAFPLFYIFAAEEEIRAIRLSKPFSMIKIAIKAIERQNYSPCSNLPTSNLKKDSSLFKSESKRGARKISSCVF